ncbi:MAG: hypothetical protein Q8K89_09140, partial [Actinomycetota bacterium]|nr:hypothetical protein [Actinomycetota bacterium]
MSEPEAGLSSEGRRPRARRRGGVLLGCSLALFALLVCALAASYWLVFLRPSTHVASGRPVQLEIASGASTSSIATTLAERGVVANPNMFRLRARLWGADDRMR